MAKRSKKRKKHKRNIPGQANFPTASFTWMEEDGLHALIPGEPPPEEFFQLWTENFQKELRNSPLWEEMVAKFGEQEAEKLLKQCQVELRKS